MTDTLIPDLERSVVLFSSLSFADGFEVETTFTKADDGTQLLVKKGVPVFRSGTFRDSRGEQHTWEPLHMKQLVDNWNQLREDKILESVPVRAGHPSLFGGGGEVIGWHTNLRTMVHKNPVDGSRETYLLADYEILDPQAIQKIQSGLWRNQSSEIGTWITNSEAEYWPVYQGVAYVDFSAVEGLRAFQSNNTASFSLMFENPKETPVGNLATKDTQALAGTVAEPGAADEGSKSDTQHSAAVPAAPAVVAPVYQFTLGGESTTDYAAVQKQLNVLEEFAAETIKSSRTDFVKQLAAAKKIPATMIDSMTEHALSLNDQQWTNWKSAYESAGSAPLFGQVETNEDPEEESSTGENGQTSAHSKSKPEASKVVVGSNMTEAQYAKRVEDLQSIVAMHSRTGNNVEATPAYKELQGLLALKK